MDQQDKAAAAQRELLEARNKAAAAVEALRDLLEELKRSGDYGWDTMLPSQKRAIAAAWVKLVLLGGREPLPALPSEPPAPLDLPDSD